MDSYKLAHPVVNMSNIKVKCRTKIQDKNAYGNIWCHQIILIKDWPYNIQSESLQVEVGLHLNMGCSNQGHFWALYPTDPFAILESQNDSRNAVNLSIDGFWGSKTEKGLVGHLLQRCRNKRKIGTKSVDLILSDAIYFIFPTTVFCEITTSAINGCRKQHPMTSILANYLNGQKKLRLGQAVRSIRLVEYSANYHHHQMKLGVK